MKVWENLKKATETLASSLSSHSISHSPKLSLMFLDRTLKAQYKFSIYQFTYYVHQ